MKHLPTVACCLALAIAPEAAGSVLVIPFAANAEIGGKLLRTTLLATNRSEVERSFSVSFIPAGAPFSAGVTVLPRTFLAPRSLTGCCREFPELVPVGGLGMLEIRGAPQVRLTSVLEVIEDGTVVGRIEVPALDPGDLVSGIRPFGADFELDADTVIAGFVHLGETSTPAPCGVDLVKPTGGLAGFGVSVPPGTLVLENVGPRLRAFFSGEVSAFGEFQCLQNSVAPFLVVVDSSSPSVTFVTPAKPLR